MRRFFTVQEANELIPFLTESVSQMREAYGELQSTWLARAPEHQDIMMCGGMPVEPRHYDLLCRLQSLTTEIGAKGCQLKDVEGGLVDFPTVWEGREVYLCWKLGESEVGFWHEIDAGFAGRQPLKTCPERKT